MNNSLRHANTIRALTPDWNLNGRQFFEQQRRATAATAAVSEDEEIQMYITQAMSADKKVTTQRPTAASSSAPMTDKEK